MLRTEDIAHPAIRAAAVCFERETGRSLAAEVGDERNEGIIAIFLLMNGYSSLDPDPGGGTYLSAAQQRDP